MTSDGTEWAFANRHMKRIFSEYYKQNKTNALLKINLKLW